MRKFLQDSLTETAYYLELILSAILGLALLALSTLLFADLLSHWLVIFKRIRLFKIF